MIFNSKTMSWKTSVLGAATIIGAIATVLTALLDDDKTTVPKWDAAITAVLAGVGLLFSRDDNKTSEQVGAGETK